jgi:hypothetical protein
MGLFSFNPVDPTEVSLRGFVSEHSKRRVPHSLRYVRLDGFLPIQPMAPTELSLRGFVSKHSRRRVPHSQV